MKKWMLTGLVAALFTTAAACAAQDGKPAPPASGTDHWLQPALSGWEAAAQFALVLPALRTVGEAWLLTAPAALPGGTVLRLLAGGLAPEEAPRLAVCVD